MSVFPPQTHFSLFLPELGLLMKSCIDQGQLVPDDVISRLILKDLRALENSSWLLDGGSSSQFIVRDQRKSVSVIELTSVYSA